MQTFGEIRSLVAEAGVRPRKTHGQSFLIDLNLMAKLVELAEIGPADTVLEVGAGTGSLTEELLERAARVVAAELDARLCALVRRRLGEGGNLTLICGDVLAGKHAIAPGVLAAVAPAARLVANLPYGIATPLVALCLGESWRSAAGRDGAVLFDRLTFTAQQEVADRLAAGPGGRPYGPVSVLTAAVARLTTGRAVPASAFWPRPKVATRMLRIDFDADRAGQLADVGTLQRLLALAFAQRRKQIGSILHRKPPTGRRASPAFSPAALEAALAAGGIDPTARPQQIAPEQYVAAANALAAGR